MLPVIFRSSLSSLQTVNEIVYAASGQEALINHALRDDRSGGRRIILVDNPEDIRRIDCPGISGFCTVDAAGQVHYFKKTGGT